MAKEKEAFEFLVDHIKTALKLIGDTTDLNVPVAAKVNLVAALNSVIASAPSAASINAQLGTVNSKADQAISMFNQLNADINQNLGNMLQLNSPVPSTYVEAINRAHNVALAAADQNDYYQIVTTRFTA